MKFFLILPILRIWHKRTSALSRHCEIISMDAIQSDQLIFSMKISFFFKGAMQKFRNWWDSRRKQRIEYNWLNKKITS